MATVTIDKKTFMELVGRKISDKELDYYIPLIGVGLEEMHEDSFVIDVNPNRPDMLSQQGFARAFASFIGLKEGVRRYSAKKSDYKVIIDSSVKKVRPYTACAVVKNLRFNDERIKDIIQVQEKLHITIGRNRKKAAIGIYPFEKIKMPIRFLAMPATEIKFRPLEYPGELTGLQILSKHPTGREYAYLLEGQEEFPVFIDASNKILSMPPIINSHDTGKITQSTTDVFIECSGFDYKVLAEIITIITTALADMGGEIYEVKIIDGGNEIISPNLSTQKMKLDLEYVNSVIGININKSDAKNYLRRMGMDLEGDNVIIPCYRIDILHKIDLVEDIAIAYGYDNLKPELPAIATIAGQSRMHQLKNIISNLLIGLGLLETNSYCVINSNDQTVGMANDDAEIVKLANAHSTEYNSMRHSILPSLLNILKINKHHEYPQSIFETGYVFSKDSQTETGVAEKTNLAVVMSDADYDYTTIRQVLDYLASNLGLAIELKEESFPWYIRGRSALIKLATGECLGSIGEVNPAVLENFELFTPVVAMEINLDLVLDALGN